MKHALVLAAALALVACGGGGGGGGSNDTPRPPVDTVAVAKADPGSPLPADWQRGVFAEIFVRAYQDSDGDGIGDLRGLIQRLDYLQDLGIRGLWLMPVTRSQDGDHGYAVADYRRVETAYGSLADLDALIAAAHARGIAVVLDYVMNHSAAEHPAFVNAGDARDNPFRDWYVWRDSAPSGWSVYGGNPWHAAGTGAYFGAFWDQMPDWNLRNAEVVAWHHDNLRFWLNRGVDGFRFDAVGNLVENGPAAWADQPENDTLLAGVRTLLAAYERRWLVCEGPGDPLGYAATTSCGSAFAFGLNNDIVAAAKGDAAAAGRVAAYFTTAPARMATMLSNHDHFAGRRAWDQFGGNVARYKLAAATYLLLPGTPFVYYGEELGMAGASAAIGNDPQLRTPMSWTADKSGFTTGTPFRALSANVRTQNAAAQVGDADSLHGFYKAVIGLRNTLPALTAGDYRQAGAAGSAMRFQRRLGAQTVQVAINFGSAPAALSFAGLPASVTLAAAWPAGGAALVADASGTAAASVPAQALRVWVVGD
jgi:alpha-amylase